MGIIQSAVNQSLTGTAFLLGQNELYKDVYARNKANREGEKRLKTLKEQKEKAGEDIEVTASLYGDEQKAEFIKEGQNIANKNYEEGEADIKRVTPKYATQQYSDDLTSDIMDIVKESLDKKTKLANQRKARLKAFEEALKNPNATTEEIRKLAGGNN